MTSCLDSCLLNNMLFVLLLAFRVLNATVLQTFFNPDEYWQSLEVAHHLSFGYGYKTWEWISGIRSYANVLPFAFAFSVLKVLKLDSPAAVLVVPKLLQASAAAAADLYVFKLSKLLSGAGAARWTLACQLSSWFNFFCLSRTYANSLEATLTVCSVYYWMALWKSSTLTRPHAQRMLALAVGFASLSGVIRPPSLLFWAVVGVYELWRAGSHFPAVLAVAMPTAALVLIINCVIDWVFYERWVFVPWEFFKFNVLQGGSAQYGSHPWHWNFCVGFPVVTAGLLPLGLCAATHHTLRPMAWLLLCQLLLYSIPAHKEFRFLLPALQLFMPLCGASLQQAWITWGPVLGGQQCGGVDTTHGGQQCDEVDTTHGGQQEGCNARRSRGQRGTLSSTNEGACGRAGRGWKRRASWKWYCVVAVCLGTQVPIALYCSLVHQRGTISVMSYIRKAAGVDPHMGVLFLMACHATPWYSHVHNNITMEFLDCSPQGLTASVQRVNPTVSLCLLPTTPTIMPHSADTAQRSTAHPHGPPEGPDPPPPHVSCDPHGPQEPQSACDAHEPHDLHRYQESDASCDPHGPQESQSACDAHEPHDLHQYQESDASCDPHGPQGSQSACNAHEPRDRHGYQESAASHDAHGSCGRHDNSPGLPEGMTATQFFLHDPVSFVGRMLTCRRPVDRPATHVIMFGHMQQQLDVMLQSGGYREEVRLFHSHVGVDDVEGGDVVVYRKIR